MYMFLSLVSDPKELLHILSDIGVPIGASGGIGLETAVVFLS